MGVCAGHGTELERCKSSCQVISEPKARRRARASSRGEVWRKLNPKARGDVQEPDLRCDASGASGHVTAKLSIRKWDAFYKSGAYAWNVLCLTPGGLLGALGSGVPEKLAEGGAIHSDRPVEVCRWHSRSQD